MNFCIFTLCTITTFVMSKCIVADDSSEQHPFSNMTTKERLLDLQNGVNSLTASRLLTLIMDKVPSSLSSGNWSSTGSVLGQELLTGLTNRAYCGACYVAANVLKLLTPIDRVEDVIAAVAVEVCIRLMGYPQYVCEGYVYSHIEMATYVAKHTPYSSSSFCAAVFGFGCESADDAVWTVKFPKPKPPVITSQPPQVGSPQLTVLHLTDPHIDRYYAEGSPADCGLALCCRKDSPASLSSVTAGPWGAYADCDIPLKTLYTMLDHINFTLKPDLVLFTGDVPAHDMWASTRTENLYLLDLISDILKNYFPEAVFMAVGNHESAPLDSFPPASVTGNSSNDWLYQKLVTTWGKWLPESTFATIRKGGFYSASAKKGLRVISINSNFGMRENYWLVLNYTDPMDQLQWLINELQKAEDVGVKVLLITHFPPGFFKMLPVWSKNFYTIINRYENTVIAIFTGHTHYDEFQIIYDDSVEKRPTRVTYISPSITSQTDLNLAYRTFTLDGEYAGSSFEVLDHTTYYADLTAGNKNNVSLAWKKLYSAKEFYELESLQATEWDKLVTRMKDADTLFQDFYSLYSRRSPAFPSCDEHCKESMLCALKSGRSQDLNMCNV